MARVERQDWRGNSIQRVDGGVLCQLPAISWLPCRLFAGGRLFLSLCRVRYVIISCPSDPRQGNRKVAFVRCVCDCGTCSRCGGSLRGRYTEPDGLTLCSGRLGPVGAY